MGLKRTAFILEIGIVFACAPNAKLRSQWMVHRIIKGGYMGGCICRLNETENGNYYLGFRESFAIAA